MVRWTFLYSCFFFFKQKMAYELLIIDWCSDVCSSDLLHDRRRHAGCLEARSARPLAAAPAGDRHRPQGTRHRLPVADRTDGYHHAAWRVAVLAVRRARPIRASVDAGADHGG